MRLICPKCDAQYDIADDVIPEGGRDVQCSSCSHTWFQMDKPKPSGRQNPPSVMKMSQSRPRPTHADTAARKPLESSIADILREEAAREKQLAAVQDSPPETLTSAPAAASTASAADETRRRIAQVAQEANKPSPAAVAAASTGAVGAIDMRSVPSIDEINETLRARAEASDSSGLTESEQVQAEKRRGFRRGFFFVLFMIALAVLPYFFASQIVENLPSTRGVMTGYVDFVNQMRVWLSDQVDVVRGMIRGAVSS